MHARIKWIQIRTEWMEWWWVWMEKIENVFASWWSLSLRNIISAKFKNPWDGDVHV